MASSQVNLSDLANSPSTSCPSFHLFPPGGSFLINGGSFSAVYGNYNVYRDTGLQILSQHIVPSAMFNSSAQFLAGRCHPGTREKVINLIKDWIMDPCPDHSVVWLYGPAGSGKSAIAQTISELLWEFHREQYGGTFFFEAGDGMGRGNAARLVTTLAYQLAVQYPSLRSMMDRALILDPALPSRSLDTQMQSLIIDPILQASDWPFHTPAIVIDGLDECATSNAQRHVLSLLSRALSTHKLPLRFLISSRPEYWIRHSFEEQPMSAITMHLALDEMGDADRDIETYLNAEFAEICRKHTRVMHSVEGPWPATCIVKRFVEESSGQFIYPSTIIKFVGHLSDFCDPRDQLRILITSGASSAGAFSHLDDLYTGILSRVPWNLHGVLKLILGGIIMGLSRRAMEIFLCIEEGKMTLILDALSALVRTQFKNPQHRQAHHLAHNLDEAYDEILITFYHLSFREFVLNKLRSGVYFVSLSDVAQRFGRASVRLVESALKNKTHVLMHPTYRMSQSNLQSFLNGLMRVRLDLPGKIPGLNERYTRFASTLDSFVATDSSCILHGSYLLRFLEAIRHWSNECDFGPSFSRTVDRAGRKVIQYLINTNQLSDIPDLSYVQLVAFQMSAERPLFSLQDDPLTLSGDEKAIHEEDGPPAANGGPACMVI